MQVLPVWVLPHSTPIHDILERVLCDGRQRTYYARANGNRSTNHHEDYFAPVPEAVEDAIVREGADACFVSCCGESMEHSKRPNRRYIDFYPALSDNDPWMSHQFLLFSPIGQVVSDLARRGALVAWSGVIEERGSHFPGSFRFMGNSPFGKNRWLVDGPKVEPDPDVGRARGFVQYAIPENVVFAAAFTAAKSLALRGGCPGINASAFARWQRDIARFRNAA